MCVCEGCVLCAYVRVVYFKCVCEGCVLCAYLRFCIMCEREGCVLCANVRVWNNTVVKCKCNVRANVRAVYYVQT